MAKSYYEFFCPVKIIAGHQALEHIPFELSALSASRPMIMTDKGIVGAGLIKHVEAAFADSDCTIATIFNDIPPDSSLETVRKAAQAYRDNNCDAIIAVGGGSVIDTSKAANILVTEGGDDLLKYSGAHNLKNPLKPFFVVPTTSGTGSETTLVAVIADVENEVKLPFTSYFLMPNAAILDSRMTLTLPAHITAMTAMDAMTHAVEAYTCLGHNPMSEAYAVSAIKRISSNLLTIMSDPQNKDARLELAQASTMAGAAFSNSMVGLVHSIGHSIGAVCHLPHGLCMSLLLPYVLEYNLDVNGERIGELLMPLAGVEEYVKVAPADRPRAAIAKIREMRDALYEGCKLPRTLTETGKVTKDQFEQIIELAINDGSILFNPKEADREDILSILNAAWE